MRKNLFVPISLIGFSFATSLMTFASPARANTEVIYDWNKPNNEVPSQIINLIVDNQGKEGIEVPTTSPNYNTNVTLPTAPIVLPANPVVSTFGS